MIPVVDLTDESAGKKIVDASRTVGFFYVLGHGIDSANLFALSKSYFDQALDVKLAFPTNRGNEGYARMGQERLDLDSEFSDVKESFNISEGAALPAALEADRVVIDSFFKSCHRLALTILGHLAVELGLDRDFFIKSHQESIKTSNVLRLLHYPPSSQPQRAGCHSDYGSMTLLFQKDIGGLQVLPPGIPVAGHEDQFIDVPVLNDGLVVNIADLLQLWTDSYLYSAQHRVISPKGQREPASRYSIAFFVHPIHDVKLSVIPSAVIKASSVNKVREYEMKRITALSGGRDAHEWTAKEYLDHRLKITY